MATGRVRLGDYLLSWVEREHDWAPATARKHATVVRVHLVPALGAIRLAELSVRDVEGYLARLGGRRTTVHIRGSLRRALADANRDGLVSRNVAALASPPRVRERERPVLDADQARLLIDSTRDTRYGPLWAMLITTGMRISEALGLAWSDVELGGNDVSNAMSVLPGNGDDRSAPRAQGARPGGQHPTGPSIQVRHALQRVGHSTIRVTMDIYATVLEGSKREAADAMQRALG